MEVHHHPHIEGKRFKHYLWEFFMLFLAVFCGFLAENIREQQLEHVREKQYMRSLLTDVREDTATINKSISTADTVLRYEDSVIFYLYEKPPVDFLPEHFLDLDFHALLRLKAVFNEITAEQLKNAGNFRLIRDPDIIRRISLYWTEQENTRISLDRYLNYRNRGREFAEKLFAFSDYDLVSAGLIKTPAKGVRVIRSDPELWAEYSNILSHCIITVSNYLDQQKKIISIAKDLIMALQKKYNLD